MCPGIQILYRMVWFVCIASKGVALSRVCNFPITHAFFSEKSRLYSLSTLSPNGIHAHKGERVLRYSQLTLIVERHSRLLSLLKEGSFSTPMLADSLGVSEQTVYRDIDYLKQNGHVIRAVRLSRQWAYQLDNSNDLRSNRTE